MTLPELVALLGPNPVLLPCNPGAKSPKAKGWEETTYEQTQSPEYQRSIFGSKNNVGVLQGGPGGSLCSIDLDSDQAAEEFKAKNPWASNTLITRGARGCNIWVRFSAGYPDKVRKVKGVGEFRAKGGQTVIHGRHPSGHDYSVLQPSPVVTIRYEEVDWPESWKTKHGGKREGAGRKGAFPSFWTSEADRPHRRRIAEELLGPVRWEEAKGYFDCPNKAQHTVDGGQKDAVVFLDGVPKAHCSHSHCEESNDSLTSQLRERVADQETVLFRPGQVFTAHKKLFESLRDTERFLYRGGIVEYDAEAHGVQEVTKHELLTAISKHGIMLTKPNAGGKITPFEPNPSQVDALIHSSVAKQILPPIASIPCTPVPLFSNNNEMSILESGYDRDSGILVLGNRGAEEVEFEPAVKALREVLSMWSFATEEDEARAFAAMVTPALHFGSYFGPNIPMWVVVADRLGAGKSELQRAVASIYNAEVDPINFKPSGISSMEEAVNHQLRKGASFVQIDNIRGHLDSSFLEMLLTSRGGVPMRGAYQKMQTVGGYKFIPMLNGNQGFTMSEDLASRCYIIKILAQNNHSWDFKDGTEIRDYIPLRAPFYIGCILRILKEWAARGRPTGAKHNVRFHAWGNVLGGIATLCGFADPTIGMAESGKTIASPERSWFEELMELAMEERANWFETDPAPIIVVSEIWQLCDEFHTYPDSVGIKSKDAGRSLIGQKLKKLLKTFGNPVPLGTGCLHSVPYRDNFRVLKNAYVFSREGVISNNLRPPSREHVI